MQRWGSWESFLRERICSMTSFQGADFCEKPQYIHRPARSAERRTWRKEVPPFFSMWRSTRSTPGLGMDSGPLVGECGPQLNIIVYVRVTKYYNSTPTRWGLGVGGWGLGAYAAMPVAPLMAPPELPWPPLPPPAALESRRNDNLGVASLSPSQMDDSALTDCHRGVPMSRSPPSSPARCSCDSCSVTG